MQTAELTVALLKVSIIRSFIVITIEGSECFFKM